MFPGNLDNLLESKHCFKALIKFVIVFLVYEHRYDVYICCYTDFRYFFVGL
jgi:hypothetical protein